MAPVPDTFRSLRQTPRCRTWTTWEGQLATVLYAHRRTTS